MRHRSPGEGNGNRTSLGAARTTEADTAEAVRENHLPVLLRNRQFGCKVSCRSKRRQRGVGRDLVRVPISLFRVLARSLLSKRRSPARSR